MARFSVYKNNDNSGYLLDVQSDILSGLNTRAVVPLLRIDDSPKAASYLNPTFVIENESYVMLTQYIAAIPESELNKRVTNLTEFHSEIMTALDMLFTGF
jgi:toxin CcdB